MLILGLRRRLSLAQQATLRGIVVKKWRRKLVVSLTKIEQDRQNKLEPQNWRFFKIICIDRFWWFIGTVVGVSAPVSLAIPREIQNGKWSDLLYLCDGVTKN